MGNIVREPSSTQEHLGPAQPQDPRRVWESEPDRKEWIDPATGYACVAHRGPVGAWCGYVAVPPGHPAHGLNYYSDSFDIEDLLGQRKTLADAKVQHAVNQIEVHGGLTYSGGRWDTSCGAPADAWWFGFDCAHAGDYSPTFERIDCPVLGLGKPTGWGGVIEYRDLAYVEAQTTALAAQLAQIADGSESDRVTDDAEPGKGRRAPSKSPQPPKAEGRG